MISHQTRKMVSGLVSIRAAARALSLSLSLSLSNTHTHTHTHTPACALSLARLSHVCTVCLCVVTLRLVHSMHRSPRFFFFVCRPVVRLSFSKTMLNDRTPSLPPCLRLRLCTQRRIVAEYVATTRRRSNCSMRKSSSSWKQRSSTLVRSEAVAHAPTRCTHEKPQPTRYTGLVPS